MEGIPLNLSIFTIDYRPVMDAPFRVIGELFLPHGHRIAGVGMVCSIAVAHQHPLPGLSHMRLAAFQLQRHVQGLIPYEPDHQHRVRSRHKVLRLEGFSIPQVLHPGGSVLQIQGSPIGRYLPFGETQPQGSQRLISLAEMALQVLLKLIGPRIILHVQGFPYLGKPFRAGLSVPAFRLAGPKGDVVQGHPLLSRSAIDHGAQAAVSNGKSLFEEAGRTVILQNQILTPGTGQESEARKQAKPQTRYSHISS